MATPRPLSPYPGMPEDEHAHLLERAYRNAERTLKQGIMKGSKTAIRVTRLTPEVRAELCTAWNNHAQLTHAHHDPDDLPGFVNQCFSVNHEGQPQRPPHVDPQRFEMALWADQKLCAIAHGREIETIHTHGQPHPARAVWVCYAAGAPEKHPFKGKTLQAVHTVAAAYARLAKASHVLYLGPLSPGSIEQVERGAIPINQKNRSDMWKGLSIHAPVSLPAAQRARLFNPNASAPPLHIDTNNRGVYQKLFTRSYGG